MSMVECSQAALLLVDLQEKLLPVMHEGSACLSTAVKLVRALRICEVPVLVTEQNPSRLGATVPEVREAQGDAPVFQKMRFSACVESVQQHLRSLNRLQIVLAGVETHVCVLQTAMELLEDGLEVVLCVDATTSRRPLDREVALQRLLHRGVTLATVESVIFECLREAGGEKFRQILPLVK